MHKGLRRLSVTSLIIGTMILGLLTVSIVLEPEWGRWLQGDTNSTTSWIVIGRVTIALLMLVIPTAHIAWLIVGITWLNRLAETGQAKACPHCRAKVQAGWKACPYCGGKLPLIDGEK
jgi:hypothetical protein